MPSSTRRVCRAVGLLALSAFVGGSALADVAPSANEVRPLLIGSEVPAVTLTSVDGADFDLRAETTEQPSILLFYRGGW